MFYLFRFRATTRPTRPSPINVTVLGSGTAVMLPLVVDGAPPLQPPGSMLQGGLSASKEVDIINRNKAIIVFIIPTRQFLYGYYHVQIWQGVLLFGSTIKIVWQRPMAHPVILSLHLSDTCLRSDRGESRELLGEGTACTSEYGHNLPFPDDLRTATVHQ